MTSTLTGQQIAPLPRPRPTPGRRPRKRPAWVARLLLLSVAIGAAACGSTSERYACDTEGCYACDGYGCRPIAAPPAASCAADTSCPTGYLCTQAGCAKSCGGSDECPRGTVCSDSLCVAPGSAPSPRLQCTKRTDCAPSETCVGSRCEACGGTAGPCACTEDDGCREDESCVAATCVPKTDTCSFSSECATGRLCVDGQCKTSCETSTCAPPYACTAGVCTKGPENLCTRHEDCPRTVPFCIAGACTASCADDTHCAATEYCQSGACIPDQRPAPNCSGDSECGGGQTCKDRFCRYVCRDDATCAHIDARIAHCAQDGVCRTEVEAHPQCLRSSDCPNKTTCVSNTCR